MLPHAYYSEIIQTSAAVIGFSLGIWAVWDARLDEAFWRHVYDEEMKLGRLAVTTKARLGIARVHVKSELATVVAQTALLVAGVSGMFLPPPEHFVPWWSLVEAEQELLAIAISRYTMSFITLALVYKSFIRRRGRINYVRTVRKTDPKHVVLPSGMAPDAALTSPEDDSEECA